MAEERERSEGDIDLIIVGDVAGPELAFSLRPVQDRLCRPVNVTRYTPREFASKVRDANHFLVSVLRKKRIFLIGGEHDLGEVAGRVTGGSQTHKQERVG